MARMAPNRWAKALGCHERAKQPKRKRMTRRVLVPNRDKSV